MKYQKKPVVIETWKANDFESDDKLPEWVFQAFIDRNVGETGKPEFDYYVNTLEGKMYFNNGDYLIKGVHDELYSCKPDIFEETYLDVSQLEENQERIITLDSYEDISLELVLVDDEVNEYRVTGCLENGWSYWFTDFEEAVLSYFEAKLTNN